MPSTMPVLPSQFFCVLFTSTTPSASIHIWTWMWAGRHLCPSPCITPNPTLTFSSHFLYLYTVLLLFLFLCCFSFPTFQYVCWWLHLPCVWLSARHSMMPFCCAPMCVCFCFTARGWFIPRRQHCIWSF